MAAGAGMYRIAIAGVLCAVLILTAMWVVMRYLPGRGLSSETDDR
jgi:small-conductance mechanosensitive channel